MMSPPASLPPRAQEWLAAHPRVVLATKTALAASAAWLLVRQLGGFYEFFGDYPYYAPLGAVVAVTNTVASSARDAGQAVLAVLIGVSLAFVVRLLDVPPLLDLAVVVGLGTVLGGLPWIRELGSWVPISGLFVLLVGGTDPVGYSAAYLFLTALGALVGIAVNLLMPPLPLLRTRATETRVRHLMADQLDVLADGLLAEVPLSQQDWKRRQHDLLPRIHELEAVLTELNEARRANWRAGHWQELTDHRYEQARALHQLSLLVEDVSQLIVHRGHLLQTGDEPGGSLLDPAGRTLQSMARLLRSLDGPTAEQEHLEDADAAVQRLADAIRASDAASRQDGFAAASIVTSVRRAVATLTPDELAHRIPSSW